MKDLKNEDRIGSENMNIAKIESQNMGTLKTSVPIGSVSIFEDSIESDDIIEEKETNSLAVIRADDLSKVKTALCDLIRYAHLTFAGKPRKLEPIFADNILISVMKSPLRMCCNSASIVPLNEEPSAAIGRLRKIHPPAHVIIVSPRHEIYDELVNYVDILPEVDINLEQIDSDLERNIKAAGI